MKTKKIHIAFIIHNASPVPYFNWFAQKALNSSEFSFSFVFLNESCDEIVKVMAPYQCPVYHIPFSNGNRKRSMVSAIFKLRKLFRRIKPDIVHSHLFYDGVSAMLAAKLSGIKIRIQTKQSTGFNWYYAPSAVKFDRLKNRLATHLIAVSTECKEFVIEKERADPRKVFMVNHGIRLSELSASDPLMENQLKERFRLQGKKVVVTVARYISWKGYTYLIEAAAKLVKQHPDLVFLAVGEGPQRSELEKLIQVNGLEQHFILTGFLKRESIPSLYKISDIYVHPALREPFGFVIAEAMINGVPIVSTNTGASRDAIEHKVSGYLIPYENVSKIVEGVEFMLTLEPEKMEQLKSAEIKRATEKFDFENMWNGYTAIYRKAYYGK